MNKERLEIQRGLINPFNVFRAFALVSAFWGVLSSCSPKITPKMGEYLIYNQKFKGNQRISSEELEALIPNNQKTNLRPLGLPILPGVMLYNLGEKYQRKQAREEQIRQLYAVLERDSASLSRRARRRYERQIAHQRSVIEEGHWLMKTGEAPAFVRETEIKETAQKIETYLKNRGYLEATVSHDFGIVPNNRVKITYQVSENRPYVWRNIDYRIKDVKIDSLVRKVPTTSVLRSDSLLNKGNLEAERSRIERLLKENGYYTFSKQYVRLIVNDTIRSPHENQKWVDIVVLVDNPPNGKHQVYRFDNIQLTALDLKKTAADGIIDTDTTTLNGIKYVFVGRNFPIKLLDSRILIRPNRLYNIKNREETEQQLSSLEQFTFTNVRIDTLGNNRLRAMITAPTLNKYEITNEIGVNSVGIVGGGALNSTFRVRNLFGGLESLELNGSFAYQGQAGYNNSLQRSPELGLNASLVFPELLIRRQWRKSYKNPKTRIGLGFNYTTPTAYRRYNFRLSANYQWQNTKHGSFSFSPLDVNIIRTDSLANKDSRDFFTFLEKEFQRGNNLKLLFGRQFSSSMSGSYTYNTQIVGQNTRSHYFRAFAESGGTFLNLLRNANNPEPWLDKVIGDKLAYFQFLKFNVDYRHNKPLARTKSFAYRINTGLALPYGDNSVLPYEKNFFIGGASSLRAWSPRTLGPGSAPADITPETQQYLPQPADILIEGSAEYRTKLFHFVVDVNGAAFVDVGNVWKLRDVPTKPNLANFDVQRFWREFAVGTGLGLRFDFSYFVFRWDMGIKVYDPSQTGSNRFLLDKLFLNKTAFRTIYPEPYKRLNPWNIGIGYPF